MMDIKRDSLLRALGANGLLATGLPRQYNPAKDGFWIRALVLVVKSNLEECYCLYHRKADGMMLLREDYGGPGIIMSIKSIHPFTYFDEVLYNPPMSASDRRDYLVSELSDRPGMAASVSLMTDDEVTLAIIDEGIHRQLSDDDEARRRNKEIEGSDVEGTNIYQQSEARFQKELEGLIRDGVSKVDIREFKMAHKREMDELLQSMSPASSDDDESLADEIRREMEVIDAEEPSEASIDGEFDAIEERSANEIAVEAAEYRADMKRQYKRKWNRNQRNVEAAKDGTAFENEYGEIEAVETIAIPGSNDMRGGIKSRSGEPVVVEQKPKRKRGRPRKNK